MKSVFALTAILSGCGPAPSSDDVGVLVRDAGPRDRVVVDRGGSDSTVLDQAAPDQASADSAVADGTGPDLTPLDSAVASDSALPDTRAPDLGSPDTYLFYGPYVATGLPRVINDATANGPTLTTVVLNVPATLNVDFADVHVEISHEDVRDLLVQLVPPVGNSDTLYDGTSCSSACPTNRVLDQRLNIFNDTRGNWVLRLTDRNQSRTGVVQAYTLNFIP